MPVPYWLTKLTCFVRGHVLAPGLFSFDNKGKVCMSCCRCNRWVRR